MANKKDPPKKKYKDINKYLPDFSSAASTTYTNKSPILSSAKIKQDVKKLENDEAAKKLLKSNPALGFKGKVPESDKVDYRYTNSQSKSYSGNPNMAFVRAGKTGAAGKMAEDNFNIETLGAMLPLAGISKGNRLLNNIPKQKVSFIDNAVNSETGLISKRLSEPKISINGREITHIYKNKQGENIGNITFVDDKRGFQVLGVEVEDKFKRQGYGEEIYKNLNNKANQKNKTVFSEGNFTHSLKKDGKNIAPAKNLWEKLISNSEAELTNELTPAGIKKPIYRFKSTPAESNISNDFKSEINWSKWNKEIPENTQLMDEYNAIEQQAKANGTWMKNPDGSKFKGTPEQFVQQNSENFKNAFPNAVKDEIGNIQINYHGSPNKFEYFDESKFKNGQYGKGIYTSPNKELIERGYAKPKEVLAKDHIPSENDNLYQLYIDAKNQKKYNSVEDFWDDVDYRDVTEFGKTKLDFPTVDDIRQKYPELIKDYNLNTDDKIRSFYNNTFPRNNNKIRDQFKEVLPDVDFLSFNEGSLKPQVTPFHKARIKSAVGNNGMFDMTNPNIYKAVVPAAIGGAGLIQQAQGGNLKQYGKGGPKPKSSLNSKDFRNLSQKYKDDYFNGGNEDSISDKIMSEGYNNDAAIKYARYMQALGPTSGNLFDTPSSFYEMNQNNQMWPNSYYAKPRQIEGNQNPSLGIKRVGNDLRPSSDNPNIPTKFATGGLINNNNNNMIKEFNGDSHNNPSEGIKYGNILVEDGELEHNGYIFSKDANETKEAKKQMNKRSLRTDENGYVWDRISRQSLDSKMKDLAKRHEEARLSEEYDNMVQNQIGMLPDFGGTAGGRMKYATGGFNDMPVNTPQMITNQQPVNNFGGGLNASSNFKPDARFSPGFKPSSDPSIANPQRYKGLTIGGNISGGKKGGSGMSSGEAAGYAAAAGNLASTLGELGSDDPYAKVGLGEKDQGTQIAESTTDTVVSAIPFVGQWYGAGKGLASGAEAVRDEARAQGEDEAAQAWSYMKGTIDPLGSWFDLKSDLDKGVEGTTGAAIANVFLPGLGDAIMEPNRRKWAEQQKKKQENKLFLDNRDYGGTEMDEVAIRDRQTAGKGGPRMMYENGGEKPKLSSLDLNFLTGQSRQENAKPPYVYDSYSGTPNVFDMNQNLPVMMQPIAQNVNAQVNTPVNTPAPVNAPVNQTQTNGVQNNYVPLSYGDYADKVDPTKSDKKKVDWGNIAETAGMGLLSNVGNLAYLLGEGKDYDKVNYGVYNPDMVNSSSSRRAIRDSIATAREGLKESNKLDRASMAMLGTQGAKQLADAEERIRLINTGMLNEAQMKNIELGRLGQDATAQNKGQALSNYYSALSGIGENMQNAYGNYNLRNADAERVAQNKIKNDWISRQMELTFGKN